MQTEKTLHCLGNIIIKPKFKFAGGKKYIKNKELSYWDSNSWFQIDKKGNITSSLQQQK